jgi:uncharacterized protein YbjQ (UPF0145 family)
VDLIIGLVVTLGLLALGFTAGTMAELRHFRQLDDREQATNDIIRTNSKNFLVPTNTSNLPPTLLCAETVIASDYFKNFLAAFRKFFGGEMRSYNSLMERARREALTRLIEQAKARGYNAICNVRLEPADIGGSLSNNKGAAMVCILGSATAYMSGVEVQRMPEPLKLQS